MNADKGRAQGGTEVAQSKNDRLFGFSRTDAGETENTKLAEARREIGFGYFIELEIGQPLL